MPVLAALAAVLAVGLVTALILARNGGSTQRQATGASTTAATSTSIHATSTHVAKRGTSKTAKTSTSKTRSSPTSTTDTTGTQRASSGAGSTTTRSSATVSASSTTTAAVTGTGLPSANDSAQAVNDYYALLPGDTDTAWSRLTSQYQVDHARGRQNFQAFWDAIAGVTVTNTSALGPRRVQATISYRYRNGSIVDEVTAFDLVRQGGAVKIAGTSVLSSTRH